MRNRVRIGTGAGPADAAFIRSVFEAHELQVVISGENHAGMFAGLGGFISLDILVAEDDAEEAVGLLRDIREGDHAALDDAPEAEADEHDDDLADERADADGVWGHHADEPAGTGDRLVPQGPFDDRRRRTGIVLVLGVVFGVRGRAHVHTRMAAGLPARGHPVPGPPLSLSRHGARLRRTAAHRGADLRPGRRHLAHLGGHDPDGPRARRDRG
jgi:hypothetical protein